MYGANVTALGHPPKRPGEELYSTDMANVSLALPTIHPTVGIDSGSSVNHQAEFAAHCAERSADEALIRGATAMAWTCIDAATNDDVRTRLLARERKPA